jgi:hypothetical protein
MDLLTEIIKMLLTIVPQERKSDLVLEESLDYVTNGPADQEVPF